MKATQVVLGLALMTGMGGWVMADDAVTPGACKADVQKFCSDVTPGQGRIVACMKAHENDLSDACKQNIASKKDQMKEKRQQMMDACKDDVQKVCADIKPGGGRIIGCLRQNQSSLSSSCQSAMGAMKGQDAPMPPTK